ncbi:hypothetical protein H4R27_000621 [Coemansia aciculifera]|nr:hypothetical protein H4R27_000621 [Coemansia aciculifera]
MVFGRQRSSARATAPQSHRDSVLVRASTISCQTTVEVGRPPMVHPMSAPIYSATQPPPIAEDGCEVVPQFFPGYHNNVPQSPSSAVRFAQNRSSISPAVSQRRAGSIKLPSSPGSDAGPRRYSNGSSVSSTSTIPAHHMQYQHQLSYQAPCYELQATNIDVHKTPLALGAQHYMQGYATTPDRLSFASSSGHSGSRQSVASLPPRSRRPASITIAHSNVPLSPVVAAASPRYSLAMPSGLPAAAHGDEIPGSYAYRRRGSSVLGNSGTTSSSSSSIVSPALPATPKEYNWAAASVLLQPPLPHSGYAAGHLAYTHQSSLHRNNTTKTVSHNDLAADQQGCPTVVSSAGHIRHLSPSRSATFATSASSPHAYQRHAYGYQSPARDNSSCTLVDQTHEVTMIQRKSGGNICDEVDVVVPNVCAVGKQIAYLPPRTANLSITN